MTVADFPLAFPRGLPRALPRGLPWALPPGGPRVQPSRTPGATRTGARVRHSGRMSVRAGPGAPGWRGRILLVENDPEVALFAVHVLTQQGSFEVTRTADPAVALRLVAAGRWDLVLTDVDVPGMTSPELLDALHQTAPALPVAVVAADSHPETAGLLRGAAEFLTKPLHIDQLLATAAALTGRATGQ